MNVQSPLDETCQDCGAERGEPCAPWCLSAASWEPRYEPWRHGGWYVMNIHYPSGAVGCVSRNYPDRKWRVVADDGPSAPAYRTRDEAARAELDRSHGTCPKRGRHRERFCGFCGQHGEPLTRSTASTRPPA